MNRKITCLVIDDDEMYGEMIASYVSGFPELELKGVYTNTESARSHIRDEDIMLCFLDMEMPGITGIDFMRSIEAPPYVIFITSHPNFALESYEVDAVDYLLKPLDQDRFQKAVAKAAERIKTQEKAQASDALIDLIRAEQDYFVVRSESRFVKIKYLDVLYIEALEDFVKIHTDKQEVMALVSLKNMEKMLPASIFVRTHRSYLVNTRHITSLDGNNIELGRNVIPVGVSFKEAVIESIVGDKLIKR